MTEQTPTAKPPRFDPAKRYTVAFAAACVVWVVLFLGLILFSPLDLTMAAGAALLLAFLVFLAGAGFQVAAAFYAMALEAVVAALSVVVGMVAALLSAFS